MSYVLVIQSNKAHGMVFLPELDNASYECALCEDEYMIRKNVLLRFDVADEHWTLQKSPSYTIHHNGMQFAEIELQDGMLLQLETMTKESLSVFVWKKEKKLRAFQKFSIQGERISVGKSETCDISLPGQHALSRLHAELQVREGGAYVLDHGVNGTYLNGERVRKQAELSFGDEICICGLTIIYLGEIIAVGNAGETPVINQEKLVELLWIEKENRPHMPSQGDTETIIHISPRTIPKLYDETIQIEGAPQKKEGDKRPVWMSILPPLTMVIPMVLGTLLIGVAGAIGIVVAAGSAVVGFTWAVINLRYTKKRELEDEQLRLGKYEEYLVRTADKIRKEFQYNIKTLQELYPSAAECSKYRENAAELWARKATHPDFLMLRLGVGDAPFQVKIETPNRGFSLQEDELAERPRKIARHYEVMHDVPLGVNLTEHNVIGVLSGKRRENRKAALELMRILMTQIAANHCYTDVKMAVVYDKNEGNEPYWSFARWLPHVWNKEQSFRFVASDESEANDVLYEIKCVLRSREEQRRDSYSTNQTRFPVHYVLFVENAKLLESQMISKYLFENGRELGITTVLLADVYENLPNDCDFVIESSSNFTGFTQLRKDGDSKSAVHFDALALNDADDMARRMSCMRVKQVEISSSIPDSISFFEMMKIHRLEELNVLDNWRKNRTYDSMRALVGQKAGGQDCYLDINEKFHGPHGLVAGTTGSGKSETLQTYILSMATHYSPLDVGFFIIDFKGGGMANLFSNLPHLLGQISNLSGNQVHRAMVSIKSENERRQSVFREHGVNHIDAYTKLYKSREASVPIPHLLIIIDEFAELKREEPEFMRELISVAQVGRSLGVHLILATQKPNGTVDDSIWSNTKFRLCLRVQSTLDSNDMLHKPDAAYLNRAGRCYLQVGNDEIYELFQSGWSGADYDPTGETFRAKSVLLNLQGRETISSKSAQTKRRETKTREWIRHLVECVMAAAKMLGVQKKLCDLQTEERDTVAAKTLELLNRENRHFAVSSTNHRQVMDILARWPRQDSSIEKTADALIRSFAREELRLPEPKGQTQLEAVVDYLADLAEKNGYVNRQRLWLPVLPQEMYLTDLEGYTETDFHAGGWQSHTNGLQLSAYIGLVDDPENQLQFPLKIDLAGNGHLAVLGGATSGKSTFLQSLLYSMMNTYSPAEAVFYLIDFSSQMLSPFENAPHVGGVVLEGQDDKLSKLFGMVMEMLQERKRQIIGGSFSQYVRMHGNTLPAVVIVIDGYANFRNKTEDRFESNLMELMGTAEGYGIYLVIASGGIGSAELQSKLFGYMRQSICLEMTDKTLYMEALKNASISVLPEVHVKGRGLVSVGGKALEYQTALSCKAEHDYARAKMIQERCEEMGIAWSGKTAAPIPEIPQKPAWSAFEKLEQYQRMVAEGNCLPVAYYQQSAALYGIDLRRVFCYLVLGREKTGKSVFLRNVACAARDVGGKLVLFDSDRGEERDTAEAFGAEYAADADSVIQAYKDLIQETNRRGRQRKQLEQQGLEDEEIAEQMRTCQPIFYLIPDLADFIKKVYAGVGAAGTLNAGFENVVNKGSGLNVFFFAAMNTSQVYDVMGYSLYNYFIRDHCGVVLGGELSSQQVIGYQNVPYLEQTRQLKPGLGYAADLDDNHRADLIVIPNHRRLVQG